MSPNVFKTSLLTFPLSKQKTHQFCEFNGYAMPAQEIVFGRSDLRRNKPVLNNETEKRLDLIAEQAINICTKAGFDSKEMKPLEHGKDGVIFELDADNVLRMQLGKSKERFNDPDYFLQAATYEYNQSLNVTFEILPKVTTDVTADEVMETSQAVKEKHGIVVWDQIRSNFGRTKEGRVVIIDPDSYQSPKQTVKP